MNKWLWARIGAQAFTVSAIVLGAYRSGTLNTGPSLMQRKIADELLAKQGEDPGKIGGSFNAALLADNMEESLYGKGWKQGEMDKAMEGELPMTTKPPEKKGWGDWLKGK